MPRYRTVLSSLVCPSNSWTARRFLVRRYISVALVRRIVCVPYAAVSRPIEATYRRTIRAYYRVDTCGEQCNRLGKRYCSDFNLAWAIQAATALRVGSVNSNCTGRWVFLCITMARGTI
jgi:hypothetical protein